MSFWRPGEKSGRSARVRSLGSDEERRRPRRIDAECGDGALNHRRVQLPGPGQLAQHRHGEVRRIDLEVLA